MDSHVYAEDYFDRVVCDSLKPLFLCVIPIYLGFVVHRYLTWPAGWERDFTVRGLLIVCACLLAAWFSLKLDWAGRRSGAKHAAFVACLVISATSLHFFLGLEEHFTNIVLLVWIGCGALLLDITWTIITVLLMAGVWSAVMMTTRGYLLWSEALPFAAATLILFIVIRHRRRLFQLEFSLTESQATQSELLNSSLEQARASMREFQKRAIVRAREQEITTGQLRAEVERKAHLQSLLESAGKEDPLGRLASGVAHDFANLLTILQLNLEVLANSGPISKDKYELLEEAVETTNEINGLVEQLRAFSRRQVLSREIVRVDSLLREFTGGLAGLLPENIDLQVDSGPDNLEVFGDRAILSQALMNLCLNAAEAMPEGGSLLISYRNDSPWNEIVVMDTGDGMTKEHLSQAKDPYFTTRGFHSGRGLGLSVVDGILNQHFGELNLHSTIGKGTTAVLRLPSVVPVETDPHSVLLVVDEVASARSAADFLRRCGYGISIAKSSEHAIKFALTCKQQPAAVLIEQLSEEEPKALVRDLHQIRPGMKMVVSSNDEPNWLKPYDCAFLPKPYPLNQLKDLVDSL